MNAWERRLGFLAGWFCSPFLFSGLNSRRVNEVCSSGDIIKERTVLTKDSEDKSKNAVDEDANTNKTILEHSTMDPRVHCS